MFTRVMSSAELDRYTYSTLEHYIATKAPTSMTEQARRHSLYRVHEPYRSHQI